MDQDDGASGKANETQCMSPVDPNALGHAWTTTLAHMNGLSHLWVDTVHNLAVDILWLPDIIHDPEARLAFAVSKCCQWSKSCGGDLHFYIQDMTTSQSLSHVGRRAYEVRRHAPGSRNGIGIHPRGMWPVGL